jgi:hypothetical protein
MSLGSVVPISRSHQQAIESLREWLREGRVRPASGAEAVMSSRTRAIEL